MKHTPYPWTVTKSGRSVKAGDSIKINQSHGPGAACCTVELNFDEMLAANARLIAAAPEMIYIIERIEPIVNDYSFRCSPEGKVLSDRINRLLAEQRSETK